jgi:nitrogen fixation/metabolism regulation signal transduction histidine kinase
MKRKKFRRRNKFIKPRFQLKIAATAVVLLIICSLVTGAAIFYPLATEYYSTTDAGYRGQLAFSALTVHENLWPALACLSVVVFLGAILLSHRIAGPMYRFEKTVETLTEGDFSIRIKLRKRDEFHEFAEKINQLSEYLEKRQIEERAFRGEAKELLNQLVEKTASQNGNQADALRPITDRLLAKFDAFVA